MKIWKFVKTYWVDAVAFILVSAIFIVPFIFVFLIAAKPPEEAGYFEFSWPEKFVLFENITEVVKANDYRVLLAMWNSIILTVSSVTLIVIFAALVAYVMQRRNDKFANFVNALMFAGIVLPPAVVPTVFWMQTLGIYKTIISLVFIEVALSLPFATLILRAFIGSIPREIDEAAIIDGASPLQLFFSIILPLLRPALATIIVTSSVAIYNDFSNPLYFLPGSQNVTAQLTLYGFMSQYNSRWGLVFADVLLITIPPLILFMFFQRQIVAGMTTGAVKG